MLEDITIKQLKYLLEKIQKYLTIGIPIKESCNFGFYNTSSYFNVHVNTIKSKVKNHSLKNNLTIYDFYNSIELLCSGNMSDFHIKYFSYIPSVYHKEVDNLLYKYNNIKIVKKSDTDSNLLNIINVFAKSNDKGRREIVRNLNRIFKDSI